jgi:hypothetical protein
MALWVYRWTIRCMPSRWIHSLAVRRCARQPDAWIEVYMLAATIGLAVLWLVDGGSIKAGWLGITVEGLAVGLAAVRWAEILTASLELVVGEGEATAETMITIFVLYLMQTLFIFAIAVEILARTGFQSGVLRTPPDEPLDFLYLTWGNVTTLNSDYAAVSATAKSIVIASSLTGFALFGLFLTYTIGRFSSRVRENSFDQDHIG